MLGGQRSKIVDHKVGYIKMAIYREYSLLSDHVLCGS
jgi:hypothetical protein